MRMLQFPLSICGLDEIAGFLERGITHVISILDPEYPYPEELLAIPDGNRLVLRFDDATLAQADRIYPVKEDMERLIKWDLCTLKKLLPSRMPSKYFKVLLTNFFRIISAGI